MLFEKDNPLVTCVNGVLDDMRSAGTLDDFAQQYLSDYLGVPTIT